MRTESDSSQKKDTTEKADRRAFLKKAGMAGATAVAASSVFKPSSVLANKTIHWQMATTWPAGQSLLHEAVARFAERVNSMTEGRLKITVLPPDSQKLAPKDVFAAVSTGRMELASSVAFYQTESIPASQWFASVPYGMNAQGMNSWLYSGGGLKLWEEVYAPYRVIPRPFGNTGVEMGGWFKKKLNHVEDFKGLRMRMPGLGGKVIEKAGAIPVSLMGEEIFQAFKAGQIDAAEWIGPLHDMEMGLHRAAKYYYYPGWHEPGACIELLINADAYRALPEAIQQMVDAAAAETNLWTLCEFESRNFAALATLVKEHGVSVQRFPDSVLKSFREISETVLEDASRKDSLSRKVHEAYHAFAVGKRNWDEISERPYYDYIDSKPKDLRRWLLPDNPY